MNLHLRPNVSDRGSFTLNAYMTTGKIRKREVEQFYQHVSADLPLIVAGDLNERDHGEAIGWLREKGLTNALYEFDRYTQTWRWQSGFVSVTSRLDHILYSHHLACSAARVIKAGASDHLPVVAVFERALTLAQSADLRN